MKTGSRSGGDPRLCLRGVIVSVICLWGIAESSFGLLQVLGWRSSRHALYALTGHFQNPGPFGGFIACVMAVAGAWVMGFADRGRRMTEIGRRMPETGRGMTESGGRVTQGSWMKMVVNGIAWAALGMGLLVLPASMSRAGWLGLAVALGVESLRRPGLRGWLRTHHWAAPAGGAVIIALLVGAFALKPDSALGRVHVWRMECRSIAARPWTGAGPGMGPWSYGEAQEAFFREHLESVSSVTVRVAGCPEYAYNEYLGLGVEYGLPALLLSVLLVVSSVVVLHKAGSPLAAGLTAWAVFACASYPLAVPQLRILGAVFLVAAVIAGTLRTGNLQPAAILPGVCALLLTGWVWSRGGLKMTDPENVRSVYAEGYALHQAERYAESTAVLEKGAQMSSDPMFEVIMGKNAEALGDVDKAAALYEKAHYRVPSRLYPLVRLMRLQIRQGRDAEALETAREIVAMPVNGRNGGMVRLHRETQKTLDSLEIILRR